MNYFAYCMKQVILHTVDGRSIEDVIQSYDPQAESLALESGASIGTGEIETVEIVGFIDEYRTFHDDGTVDGYLFLKSDLREDFPIEKLICKEYACKVAYRLRMDRELDKTCATGIRLLSSTRIFNRASVADGWFIYRYQDGQTLVGRLQGGSLQLRGTDARIPFREEGLEDIWHAPEVNEFVWVSLMDGSEIAGRVNHATGEKFIVLKEQDGQVIDGKIIEYIQVRTLRYRGIATVRDTPQGRDARVYVDHSAYENGFIVKQPFFRDQSLFPGLQTGTVVSFVPSVNQRYLIGRDVEVLDQPASGKPRRDSRFQGTGIILFFGRDRTTGENSGYVGSAFYHPQYVKHVLGQTQLPQGNVRITGTAFPYLPGQIYVVRYTCDQDPEKGGVQTAVGPVELVASYARGQYAKVTVDRDGTVHAVQAAIAYLPLFLRQNASSAARPLEAELTLKRGGTLHGFVTACDESAVVLHTPAGSTPVPVGDVENLRYYGTVVSVGRNSMGVESGYLSNSVFFHINSMREDADRIRLNSDAQIIGGTMSYSLVMTNKGNGLCAEDCLLYAGEERRVLFGAVDGDTVQIRTGQASERVLLTDVLPYPGITMDMIRQGSAGGALSADCTIRRHGSRTELLVRSISGEAQPEAGEKGYICYYHSQDHYGFITPEAWIGEKKQNWGRHPRDIYFTGEEPKDPDGAPLDTRRWYYGVLFRRGAAGRVEMIRVLDRRPRYEPDLPRQTGTEDADAGASSGCPADSGTAGTGTDRPDGEIGYIGVYIVKENGFSYGFVTPQDVLEEKKKNWGIRLPEDLYFAGMSLQEADGAPLDTRQYYYRAAYRRIGNRTEVLQVLERCAKAPGADSARSLPQGAGEFRGLPETPARNAPAHGETGDPSGSGTAGAGTDLPDGEIGFIGVYIVQENGYTYGFITPLNALETKKRNWSGRLPEDLHFGGQPLQDEDGAPLDTRKYYYRAA